MERENEDNKETYQFVQIWSGDELIQRIYYVWFGSEELNLFNNGSFDSAMYVWPYTIIIVVSYDFKYQIKLLLPNNI